MSEENKVGYYFLYVILPILILVICGLLNYEFIMGDAPTIKNLMLTLIYISVWIYLTMVSKKIESTTIFKFYIIFWLLTIFSGFIVFIANMTQYSVTWGILFVGIFMPQWYGIRFFINDFIYISITVVIISIMFLFTNILRLIFLNK